MSFDTKWDIDKYKEDHENDEHWQLRRAFMERWKNEYPEERLVCLTMVFVNMEFMGCRYPTQVMQEVARLSKEVAQTYRKDKKKKLHRTFVSASVAAEDRAKGVKREGGVIVNAPLQKSAKINFIPQGQGNSESINISESSDDEKEDKPTDVLDVEKPDRSVMTADLLKEMEQINYVDVNNFNDDMFNTEFGRLVLMIRPWENKLWNIHTSCQMCSVPFVNEYIDGACTVRINGKTVAQAEGATKADAKSKVEVLTWNLLREEIITLVVKEQWIPHGDARISVSDVSGTRAKAEFGTLIENSVATKMMKLMGWKGGGLGVDSQGIAEPVKPNLQMVNRAGLGSSTKNIGQLRKAAIQLMQRYISSDTIDVDLVFSSEFSKEERAQLHQCAQRQGLASKSYGDKDRFLVVKKKLNPFALVRAVVGKGGSTPKYEVFIPEKLSKMCR